LETCAVQLEAKMDDEAFVLYLLRKTFHKLVQSSTMDTEVGKNLPARILYLKKGKKTRKLFMFLAAIMLTNPPIDRSVWSLLS